MIAIVDYGVGNLGSIRNMLKKAGAESVIVSTETQLRDATKIILPGIGAFDHCMQQFNASGLRAVVTARAQEDKVPTLGICVGLQMLMEGSEEGKEPGLGWIKGQTIRFRKEQTAGLKIPHMGWTDTLLSKNSPLTESVGDRPRFYYVHSYHVMPEDPSDELVRATYGYDFTAGVERGNIYGVQFHPEKSHRFGLRILENFSRLS